MQPDILINPDVRIIPVHDTLYEVREVFTHQTLDYLRTFFGSDPHMDVNWCFQGPFTRLLFPKQPSDPIFFPICNQWQTVINKIYDRPIQALQGKLWLDLPGHEFLAHRDSADIAVMTQIYLWSNDIARANGTIFLEPERYEIAFETNCGYININDPRKLHCTEKFQTYRVSMGMLYALSEIDPHESL